MLSLNMLSDSLILIINLIKFNLNRKRKIKWSMKKKSDGY